MDRRTFIKHGAVASAVAGGASLAGCSTPQDRGAPAVRTRERVRWRLASSFPRSLETIYGGAEHLATMLEAMSDGHFSIRAYPAGEIVPAFGVLDAAQQATVQVAHTASYYFTGKNPALAFDACVPFGMTARQQSAWLDEGGGQELLDPLFADFGVLSLPAGNTGAQMGGWFRRPLEAAGDLRGLKMRIPGLGGDVMSRLGVTVQQIAGGDIFQALERGAIDATEWVGPHDDEKLGFHKIAQYYYYPGWWEPGPSLSYLINRKAWDALPTRYQEMFRAAAASSARAMLDRYDHLNPPALTRLRASGTQMRPFPRDLLEAAATATRAMLEEQASADASYRKVYDRWKKAKETAQDWFGTAELAYANFAFRAP